MKKIIMALLLGFLMIINVDAATLELKGESSKITVKDTAPTVINLNVKDLAEGEAVNKITFDFSYDKEKIALDVPNAQYGHPISVSGDTIIILKNEAVIEGTVMSFNLTDLAEEDETVEFKLTNVKITDGENVETDLEDVVIQVNLKKENRTTTRARSTSAALTGFKVNPSNATIKPAFSKDKFEYKIYVKDTVRDVTIIPSYEQGPVEMLPECTLGCSEDESLKNKLRLVAGKNEATFKFTSEDGKDEKTYKFIIYRGPTTDGSSYLASLSIDDFELQETFDKELIDYTLTVPFETESVKVNAAGEDEAASVKIKGGETLEVGENKITVTVTSAENEKEKKIYTITVTREEFVPEEPTTTDTATPIIEEDVVPTEIPKDNSVKLIIIIGAISLLLIGLAAYFIFFYKGKDKKKEEMPKVSKPKTKLQSEIIDEEKEPTSVDEALDDLMKTKEITKSDEEL